MTDSALATPKTVTELVRDRIQASFVELIPEEQFTEMVQQEIDSFTAPGPSVRQSYSERQPQPSRLAELIQAAVKERFEGQLKTYLSSDEFTNNYGEHGPEPSVFVQSFVKDNLPAILQQYFVQILDVGVQRAVRDMHHNVQSMTLTY